MPHTSYMAWDKLFICFTPLFSHLWSGKRNNSIFIRIVMKVKANNAYSTSRRVYDTKKIHNVLAIMKWLSFSHLCKFPLLMLLKLDNSAFQKCIVHFIPPFCYSFSLEYSLLFSICYLPTLPSRPNLVSLVYSEVIVFSSVLL